MRERDKVTEDGKKTTEMKASKENERGKTTKMNEESNGRNSYENANGLRKLMKETREMRINGENE